jgi:hypothetical protein
MAAMSGEGYRGLRRRAVRGAQSGARGVSVHDARRRRFAMLALPAAAAPTRLPLSILSVGGPVAPPTSLGHPALRPVVPFTRLDEPRRATG